MSGWIVIDRDAASHPMFKSDMARLGAWSWLVLNACWRPTRFDVSGRTIVLDRGQICVSVRHLAEQWGWTKSTVERFLARLRDESMIETDAGTGRMVVTICNYAKFQTDAGASGTPENPANQTKKRGTLTGTPCGTLTGTHEIEKIDANSMDCADELEPSGTPCGTANGTRAGHKRKKERIYNLDTVDALRPRARRAPLKKAVHIPLDWTPGPYPPAIAAILAQWPPGQEEAERDEFFQYWTNSNERRPDWDKTWHNRIKHQHGRIIKLSHPSASTNRHGDTFIAACAAGLSGAADRAGQGP